MAEHGFDRKRQAILTGAARVFDRRGFSAGTTKEIAAEVGLSQPAIYHYVGSKDDLLREIALRVDHDMMAALDKALATEGEPRDQLRAVIEEFVAAIVANQPIFAVYWKELHSIPPDVRKKVQTSERAFIARVNELVADLQRSGKLSPDAPTAVVTEAILGMVSWTYRWYRPRRSLDPAGVAKVFNDLIGLR